MTIWYYDLKELQRLLPLNVNAGMVHPCWDDVLLMACCESDKECTAKLQHAIGNVLYGRSERRPAENTWKNLNLNFKRTILKYLLWKVGIDAFSYEGTAGNESIVVDGEAAENFIKIAAGVRTR